ncbi:hypothetical protein ACRALDRAFT_2027258 [Sodiomyces alcalophilus JCM 7366]|uniref:uncharacterized protein n=1 Tax=Sodiomyces alcalophilus JCM 7366 TaxID=591952 RepID=UPI0039B47C5E
MWDFTDHPATVLVTNSLLALASLYTPQKYRLVPFGALLLQFWRGIRYIQHKPGLASFFFLPQYFDWYVADLVTKAVTITMMHFGVVLILEKQKPPPAGGSWLDQVRASYKILSNLRRVGTNMVAPQVPVLVDGEKEEALGPQDTPPHSFGSRVGVVCREPRVRFLARRSAMAVLLLFAEFWVKPIIWDKTIGPGYEDYAPGKEVLFRRLPSMTASQFFRECLIRTQMVFEAFWSAYAVYTSGHAVFSVICVGIGLDEPHEWPPMFGHVRESYSIRRFWVKYFDRLIYRTLKGYALLIARLVGIARREDDTDGTLTGYALYVARMLGITRREGDDDGWRMGRGKGEGEPWRRWLVNGLIFGVSAWFHAQTSWWAGWKCAYWEEVWWWTLSYFGIIAEIAAQEAMKKWAPRYYERANNGWIGKAIGFSWLFFFLFWSLPKYMYPNYVCDPGRARRE